MRIHDPKTTVLIFALGKMVVTGAKSEDDSRLASRKYARIVQKLGFDVKFSKLKIQNIVGSCDVKFPIRLEGLVHSHGQFSSYEPEVRISHIRYLPLANVNTPQVALQGGVTSATSGPSTPQLFSNITNADADALKQKRGGGGCMDSHVAHTCGGQDDDGQGGHERCAGQSGACKRLPHRVGVRFDFHFWAVHVLTLRRGVIAGEHIGGHRVEAQWAGGRAAGGYILLPGVAITLPLTPT